MVKELWFERPHRRGGVGGFFTLSTLHSSCDSQCFSMYPYHDASGVGPSSNKWFLGSAESLTQIASGSVHSDRPRYSICSNRPHLSLQRCGLKIKLFTYTLHFHVLHVYEYVISWLNNITRMRPNTFGKIVRLGTAATSPCVVVTTHVNTIMSRHTKDKCSCMLLTWHHTAVLGWLLGPLNEQSVHPS